MYREHGRPDLLREDAAIDELGARVRAFRRRTLMLVIGLSFVAATCVAFAIMQIGNGDVMQAPKATGRFMGYVFAGTLFGTMWGGHRLSLSIVMARAEAWARALSKEMQCDLEPLLEAARLFAGGRTS